MLTRFVEEVSAAALPDGPVSAAPVTESDLESLPDAARRFMRFMGVVGRPRDWSFRMHCHARFKPALDAEWVPAECWQYNSAVEVARIYHMKLRYYGIPVIGRDVYVRGRGHLVIRPLDLVTVEHDAGPEFDRAELVTWLNDATLLAPSMLLDVRTTWAPMGDDAFSLTFSDAGHAVTACVRVDARGALLDFETDARTMRGGRRGRARRARWSTPVPGWQEVGGRRLPTGGRAVWHLPTGDFAYAELSIAPGDVEFNVAPRAGA